MLVHGTLDRATSFARVVHHLADRPVTRYDRRGYGHSRAVGAGPLEDHVEDLLAVLDGRPATVAGHSYGGVVALVAAARRPDLVWSVLAFEAPQPWSPEWEAGSAGDAALAEADPAVAAETFLRHLLGDARWEGLPDKAKADRRAEGPALVADLSSIRQAPPFDPADIGVPVLVASGSRSAERHRQGARRLAAALPQGGFAEVDGAFHGAHLTHPAEFAALVRRAAGRTTPQDHPVL